MYRHRDSHILKPLNKIFTVKQHFRFLLLLLLFLKNMLKMLKIFTQLCLHVEGEYNKIVVEILGYRYLYLKQISIFMWGSTGK